MKELKGDFEKKKEVFLQKSENDDQYISLLRQENEKLKKDERVVTKVVYKDSKENNEESNLLRKENEQLKKKVKDLQKQKEELKSQALPPR